MQQAEQSSMASDEWVTVREQLAGDGRAPVDLCPQHKQGEDMGHTCVCACVCVCVCVVMGADELKINPHLIQKQV